MPAHDNQPTPHRYDVDLTAFLDQTVLGESRAVLFSALLRLRTGRVRNGLMEISATWPQHEADAITRAMERVEEDSPDDTRTEDQRNADRFLAVTEQVLGTSLRPALSERS
jgi:hypothetical protein